MNHETSTSERTLILAPRGRDAGVAAAVLTEAGLASHVCADVGAMQVACEEGAGLAVIVEEVLLEGDYSGLAHWIETQAPWSDFPVVVLARRGADLGRTPSAERFVRALGNVSFLERPFHPTTLVSMAKTALRGRRRQYEARERLHELRAALVQREQDEAHLRLMVNELNHRVKNTLATVQSIARQTLRAGDPAIRNALTSRIVALSKAHDVLTDEQWSGADLEQIAGQAAHPFRLGLGAHRVTLKGPPVRVPPKTAIALALAFHELATNATKYGALSEPAGRISFTWRLEDGAEARRLVAVWRETGGPPVSPPTRAGFGTRLLERGLASDLNGEVQIAYPPEGVVCTIRANLDPADDATLPLAPPPDPFRPADRMDDPGASARA